jgi:hypothetical protein
MPISAPKRFGKRAIPNIGAKLGGDPLGAWDVGADCDVSVFAVPLLNLWDAARQDGVDTAHHVADFPGDFEEHCPAHVRIRLSAGANTESFKSFMTFI